MESRSESFVTMISIPLRDLFSTYWTVSTTRYDHGFGDGPRPFSPLILSFLYKRFTSTDIFFFLLRLTGSVFPYTLLISPNH